MDFTLLHKEGHEFMPINMEITKFDNEIIIYDTYIMYTE